MNSDAQAIKDWLKQHQISEVECLVPDMTGNARGKFIPAAQFLDQERAPSPRKYHGADRHRRVLRRTLGLC